jgi:hypothetical protein
MRTRTITLDGTDVRVPTPVLPDRTPDSDLLGIVPYLLGFHPQRSLIVVGIRPPRDRVHVCLRYDLPDPPEPGHAHDIAAHTAAVLALHLAENGLAST